MTDMVDEVNDASSQFWDLVRERYEAGAQEYGHLTFLENDLVRMMLEEMADIVNYCTMQGIKLLMLQKELEAQLGEVGMGIQSFKGVKDMGWKK